MTPSRGARRQPSHADRANFSLGLYFGQENRIFLATRSVLWPKICRKCDSGRGSAPDPAGELTTPPDPLVGWGADTPPHTPPHSAPLAPRSSCPRQPVPPRPTTKSWRRHWSPPLFKGKVAPVVNKSTTIRNNSTLYIKSTTVEQIELMESDRA